MQAPPANSAPVSFLTPAGYQTGSCGYCKDESTRERTRDSSVSYYATTERLHVDHYQELIDRGWRRSGTVLYKQDIKRSCCPHYTIRLPVDQFHPSKDQRNAINKWNRFILGEEYIKESARLRPKSKEQKKQENSVFDLSKAVHESEYSNVRLPPEPAHRFEVSLEPAEFTEERYSVFENYQRNVHHEKPYEISRNGFRRFLCDSPLQQVTRNVDGKEQRLGSYHQCYRLDGKLVAIGVLDLLPHCVSGVYFLYHESVAKWSFGKLSALRETSFAKERGYQYYYMGFYIHSCIKMRYKGDYKPQLVLDPETLNWNPLEGRMRRLLDEKKYVSLSREENSASTNTDTSTNSVIPSSQETFESAKDAADAATAGISLFQIKMPGVMTEEEVEQQIRFGEIKVAVRNRVMEMSDLTRFSPGSLTDSHTIKGAIAELAACVGPIVSRGMIVNIG